MRIGLIALLLGCFWMSAMDAAFAAYGIPNYRFMNTPTGPVSSEFGCRPSLVSPVAYIPFWDWQTKMIYGSWRVAPDYQGKKPILELLVSPAGKLEKIKVKVTSGDLETDKASIQAVRQAFPLVPPEGMRAPRDEYVKILNFPDAQSLFRKSGFDEHMNVLQSQSRLWMGTVQALADQNWKPPAPKRSVDIMAFVDVKTGQILSQGVIRSSCSVRMDQAALNTVKKLQSVPPPQFDYPYPYEVIRVFLRFTGIGANKT